MDAGANNAALARVIESFSAVDYAAPRILALFSAALTAADPDITRSAVTLCRSHSIPRFHLYELVLQSYLFLGFPRMIEGADILQSSWPTPAVQADCGPVGAEEARLWYTRGDQLCRRVYDSAYEPLRKRVESFAPEIFRWMIFEGYGKVLSRHQLDVVTRECSIVACLVMDNRPRQLHSHIKGALNVGAPPLLILSVIEDLRDASPSGYESSKWICGRLRIG